MAVLVLLALRSFLDLFFAQAHDMGRGRRRQRQRQRGRGEYHTCGAAAGALVCMRALASFVRSESIVGKPAAPPWGAPWGGAAYPGCWKLCAACCQTDDNTHNKQRAARAINTLQLYTIISHRPVGGQKKTKKGGPTTREGKTATNDPCM